MAVQSTPCQGTYGDKYILYMEYNLLSQDIANNKSRIRLHMYAQSTSSQYGAYNLNPNANSYSIKVDGETKKSGNMAMDFRNRQVVDFGTVDVEIPHLSDGTKMVNIYGTFSISGTTSLTGGTIQFNWTLPTIPRASDVSVNTSSAKIGSSVTITHTRKNSNFTITLRYKVGSTSGTIANKVSRDTTSWTIPYSLITALSSSSGTCTIYCDTYNGSTLIGTKSTSLTISYPDATNVSLSASSVNFGGSITITHNRAVTDYRITVRYSFAGSSGTIANKVASNSTSWTVPNDLMTKIPNATSGTVTIYCDTYYSDKLIGTRSATFTAIVPSSIRPSFNTITHSEANPIVASLGLNKYVQGESKITFGISGAQGAYGSTIKSYKITFEGKDYISSSATSDIVKGSGSLTVTGTITDSRNRTYSKSITIEVLEYQHPRLTKLYVQRINSDDSKNPLGTSAKVSYEGTFFTLEGKNNCTVTVKVKETNSSQWQITQTKNFNSSSFKGESIMNEYDKTKSYDMQIEVKDKLNTVTIDSYIPTAIVAISLSKAGVGIGKVHERGALDVKGDGYFDGNIFLGQNKRINNAPRLFDLTGQVQTQSYVRSVIALCEVTNDNPNLNSFSVGTLIFHRTNGLHVDGKIEIAMSKKYNESRPNVSMLSMALNEKVYPCTFMYNGKKYGGVMVEMATAQFQQVYFFGEGNFDVFGVDYYRSSTDEILNQEVYNSINLNDVFWNQNALLYQRLPIAAIDPELIIVTRDGTTAGTQTISTTKGRMPKVIIGVASGQSPSLAYSSWGYWDNVRQRCMYYDGSVFSPVTHFLQVGTSSNRLYCTISSVSSSNITLSWTKAGNGVNTTVTLYLLIFYQ